MPFEKRCEERKPTGERCLRHARHEGEHIHSVGPEHPDAAAIVQSTEAQAGVIADALKGAVEPLGADELEEADRLITRAVVGADEVGLFVETYSHDQIEAQRGDAKTSAHYVSDLCDSHERLRRLGEDLALAMEALRDGNSADDVASLYGPKFLPALLAWRKAVEPPR